MIDKSTWKKVCLLDVAKEISIRVDNPSQSKYERFVGLEHFISGDLVIKNCGSTKDLISSMKEFKSGDVLIARRNVYLKRASLVEFDGLCSGDAIVLREREHDIEPKFLPFILNTDQFWDFANANADGSMSKRINVKILMTYEFLLPPIEDQKRIAELLWSVNRLIRSYYQNHERLQRSIDIFVANTFAEGIKKHQWKVYSLKELSDIVYGITLNTAKQKGEIELPYLRVANVFREKLDLEDVLKIKCSENEMEHYQLKENDILIVEGHAEKKQIGRAAIWNKELDICLHQNHLIRVRCGDKILPPFLLTWINSPRGRNYFYRYSQSSSGLNTINSSVVKNMSIPLCDLGKQKQICEFIGKYRNALFSCEDAILKAQTVLKSLINYTLVGGTN